MSSELRSKIAQGEEAVGVVEAFLVFPVTAFDLAIVPWSIGTNELVPNVKLGGGLLEQSGKVSFGIGKAIGKFKTVVGLDAFYRDLAAFEPDHRFAEEIGGGIGALFRISGQEAETGELIDGGVLEESLLWVGKTLEGDHLDVDLHSLTGVLHLLVGFGNVCLLRFWWREHPLLPHDPEQALRVPGISSLSQPVPKLCHTQIGISSAHIPDEL